MKTALISGVSGQDGAYLANLLLSKGYRVVGTSRDAHVSPFSNLRKLGILDRVERISMVQTDFRSTLRTLDDVKPDEIYNLAGQSSVSVSFERPIETMDSICSGTMNLLESIRLLGKNMKLYNAGSSDCFGDTETDAATEETAFRPQSPYGVAKAAAHWAVVNYRRSYGLYAANGILFNHESPLRPSRFVTKKIVEGVIKIKAGQQDKLTLRALHIQRDWGWAPEYVDAMWRVLQHPRPEDFLIATGSSYRLQDFVEVAFQALDLDWRKHVIVDELQGRPSDIAISRGDPTKAGAEMGWHALSSMPDVVRMMVQGMQENAQLD